MNNDSTIWEIASEIFYEFTLFQSCEIGGFANWNDVVILRGEAILLEVRRLDMVDNIKEDGRRRVRKLSHENIVGDRYLSDKAFAWKVTEQEPGNPICKIWRVK